MNSKSIWIKTILMTGLLSALLGITTFADNYTGCLDSVSGNTVSGWAWNMADPDRSSDITVTVKKQGSDNIVFQTTALASENRDDLILAGKGDGSHGFTAYIDWSAMEDGNYRVQTVVDNQYVMNELTYRNGEAPAPAQETLTPLGTFKTTAYCPCRSCSGRWGRNTSTGAIAAANHTVAVDPKVIPYGTKLLINGVVYTAEDRGGGVKGRHIDIFYNSHGETVHHGVRNLEVFVIS